MAHGRARDERKERQWRRWIGEWQTSGLSVRAFCQRRGLTVASFYAWRRVLRQRAAEKAAFVPVQVMADAVPAQTSALEVVLADGRAVRVAPGFDAATLRQQRAEGEEDASAVWRRSVPGRGFGQRRPVPDLHRAIPACRGQTPSIRAETHAVNGSLVPM